MSIEFRKATAADIDRIGEIYEAIHTESECGRTYTGWVRGVYPIKGTAAAALGRGDLFAEESDGKVVGAAIINRTQVNVYADTPWEVPAPDDKVMVLHTLVIIRTSRDAGSAEHLLSFMKITQGRTDAYPCALTRMCLILTRAAFTASSDIKK